MEMTNRKRLVLLALTSACLLSISLCVRADDDDDVTSDDVDMSDEEINRAIEDLSDELFYEFTERIEVVQTSWSLPSRNKAQVCSACMRRDEVLGLGGPLRPHKAQSPARSKLEKLLASLSNPKRVANFLRIYQKQLSVHRRKINLVAWAKNTNLTTANSKAYIAASLKESVWLKKKRDYATAQFTYDGLNCAQTKMLKEVRKTSAPNEASLRAKKIKLQTRIQTIYSKAKVCNKTSEKCYKYEPGLINIMAKSRDYNKLLWAWKGFRDAIGPKIRKDWYKMTRIQNIGAKEHGYHDEGAFWRSRYEVSNFAARVDTLWKDIRPLYLQLHAFVRYRLHKQYGDKINLTGAIPAHVLGDIWEMQWTSIYDLCVPYKKVNSFQVTKGMKAKNTTVMGMFHLADKFYRSMGLPKMTQQFWNNSMFVRPQGRPVVCYASAWNLEKDDVRVKMCAQVNSEYLYVVHHEMGHCQYYLAYNRHQPELFQNGANNGFHEAIGDTAALSVISPTHLKKLGIIKEDKDKKRAYKRNINFLMSKALKKIAFYPFALGLEKWRWDVFNGVVTEKNLNAAWWQNKLKYGGLKPPVARTEHDFDAGAKFHVTYSVPYIRYFVSFVIQFQFYEALCDLSGHKGDLHQCDFAGSKKAGAKFMEMLNRGNSKHWEDTLKVLTKKCHMDASSMKKYFRPLSKWLVKENKRLGNKIGWD